MGLFLLLESIAFLKRMRNYKRKSTKGMTPLEIMQEVYSILFYFILFYLRIYKAPLTVQPNQRRFQCERPLEKRKVLRERAETEVPPYNIRARVIAGISFHNRGPTEA